MPPVFPAHAARACSRPIKRAVHPVRRSGRSGPSRPFASRRPRRTPPHNKAGPWRGPASARLLGTHQPPARPRHCVPVAGEGKARTDRRDASHRTPGETGAPRAPLSPEGGQRLSARSTAGLDDPGEAKSHPSSSPSPARPAGPGSDRRYRVPDPRCASRQILPHGGLCVLEVISASSTAMVGFQPRTRRSMYRVPHARGATRASALQSARVGRGSWAIPARPAFPFCMSLSGCRGWEHLFGNRHPRAVSEAPRRGRSPAVQSCAAGWTPWSATPD
ncbi:hypothetical protein EES37_36540 [Streptomyces sp. ADI91-18]|nr:hypothetical protein EES37_36540 [Streptomyces sp. ADI91-18]